MGNLHSLFNILPLPLFALLVCVLVTLVFEFGFWLGRRFRPQADVENETAVSEAVNALLALLALMLAFTFSMAASRYEARRQIVLSEANAIGTAFLRASLLAPEIREPVEQLFRRYVAIRVSATGAPPKAEDIGGALRESEEIQSELWHYAVTSAEKSPTPITALFVQALNEVIDVHSERVMVGLRSRLPTVIWLALCSLGILAMTAAGFQAGYDTSRRPVVSFVIAALILGLAGVVTLIADLDDPRRGFLSADQGPMIDLRRSILPPTLDQETHHHLGEAERTSGGAFMPRDLQSKG